jgi:hypothetical protein
MIFTLILQTVMLSFLGGKQMRLLTILMAKLEFGGVKKNM